MFPGLIVDGERITGMEADDFESLRLELDPEACAPQYRCRACGEELEESPEGFTSDAEGLVCPDFEPGNESDPDDGEGPHDAEHIALAWCNQAGISVDPDEDSVTVTISVGDPRGAFAFTIRRIPEDAFGELAGRLVMHVPYPGEPGPHASTTALQPGTYLVG